MAYRRRNSKLCRTYSGNDSKIRQIIVRERCLCRRNKKSRRRFEKIPSARFRITENFLIIRFQHRFCFAYKYEIINHNDSGTYHPNDRLRDADAEITKIGGKYSDGKNFQEKFCNTSADRNELSSHALQTAAESVPRGSINISSIFRAAM